VLAFSTFTNSTNSYLDARKFRAECGQLRLMYGADVFVKARDFFLQLRINHNDRPLDDLLWAKRAIAVASCCRSSDHGTASQYTHDTWQMV